MYPSKPSKVALELKESGKYPNAVIMDIRKSDLIRGVRLHKSHYVFIVHETVMVILPIDPRDPRTNDDKYILFSTDENKSYYQELTVKDNKVPYESKIMLEFLDPLPDLYYSLKVDVGADGDSYFVFEDIPYSELIKEKR